MDEITNPKHRRLQVFLCHSSGDKQAVRSLYSRLRDDGFDPWLDTENLLPGQDWHQEITKAVRTVDVVLVCLSKEATGKRGYVQKEIKYALDVADEQPEGTIFLIPVKLEECNVPERLGRWQWVSIFEQSGYSLLKRALQHCAQSLVISETLDDFDVIGDMPWRGPIPHTISPSPSWKNQVAEKIVQDARDAVRARRLDLAERLYQKTLSLFANYPAALSGLANVRFHQGRYQEGINCANKAISIDVEFPYPYYQRALCLWASGNIEGAENDFKRALELNPDFEYARNQLNELKSRRQPVYVKSNQ